MQRTLSKVLLFIVIIGIFFFALMSIQLKRFLYEPMLSATDAPLIIEIKPGTPIIALAWQLKRQGLIKSPKYFLWYAKLHHAARHIKAGEYLIKPGKTTPARFLKNVWAGKIYLRQFTIVEGWSFQQILDAINKNSYFHHSLKDLSNHQIMTKFDPPNLHPEGQFYPDTYLFAKGTPDVKVLKIAFNKMQNLKQKMWAQRAQNLPYKTPEDALIVASLIEKETALAEEKPIISGVILRRLAKDMRLQIDPTVIYALGKSYQGKLTTQDLRFNSPYNTYMNKGLPPSAIAVPSAQSIYAALHPAPGDSLYFVAKGYGRHQFSATLKDQDTAIKTYLLTPKRCFSGVLILKTLANPL